MLMFAPVLCHGKCPLHEVTAAVCGAVLVSRAVGSGVQKALSAYPEGFLLPRSRNQGKSTWDGCRHRDSSAGSRFCSVLGHLPWSWAGAGGCGGPSATSRAQADSQHFPLVLLLRINQWPDLCPWEPGRLGNTSSNEQKLKGCIFFESIGGELG